MSYTHLSEAELGHLRETVPVASGELRVHLNQLHPDDTHLREFGVSGVVWPHPSRQTGDLPPEPRTMRTLAGPHEFLRELMEPRQERDLDNRLPLLPEPDTAFVPATIGRIQ